jgi:hypothetical protein
VVALAALPALQYAALERVERFDWNFVIQKLIVIAGWVLAFTLFVRLSRRVRTTAWSLRALVVPPLAALAVLYVVPRPPSGYDSRSIASALQAAALIRQPDVDPDYQRYLQRSAAASINGRNAPPSVGWAPAPDGPRPHVFVFVIDSLRRDYLSLYNRSVSFTPHIERFGRLSSVFTNAFTQYGGTWLSMPSLWAGGPVARGWGGAAFEKINALEQLIAGDGYRLVINDYTVEGYLRETTTRTFLQPDVPSVDTDLCRLLPELERQLDATAGERRPLFAVLAPMNVHLLNTRSGGTLSPGEQYPGFYAPYASRLRRLDGCFGAFVERLQARALFDESIIVLTSDHGDSLGEGGQWGHQFGLFPEHVRIPLVVHVPETLKPELTTDLSRVSFLTDIAPTIAALAGHAAIDRGPLFGSPLFVPKHAPLAARRAASFLLASSYGPTYGLLRRNGRALYVSDVAAGRDYAFDLAKEPLGAPVEITAESRQLNQRLLRRELEAFNAFYGIHPPP